MGEGIDESTAAYQCKDCGSINIDGIEKFCYKCGSKNLVDLTKK